MLWVGTQNVTKLSGYCTLYNFIGVPRVHMSKYMIYGELYHVWQSDWLYSKLWRFFYCKHMSGKSEEGKMPCCSCVPSDYKPYTVTLHSQISSPAAQAVIHKNYMRCQSQISYRYNEAALYLAETAFKDYSLSNTCTRLNDVGFPEPRQLPTP